MSARERRRRAEDIVTAVRAGPKPKRKPPEAGLPVPAISPKGPLPMQGGAEAPLAFD
ncbi:hypothetical protein [Qipengyuania marisflavi]|uniref:hypothetical protein n=1 Tax=Qipengyuania marisflavi TaxID=2486356 RepID=UPI0014861D64|nr:hypothetical protein [Qipengyuania marisflavi]